MKVKNLIFTCMIFVAGITLVACEDSEDSSASSGIASDTVHLTENLTVFSERRVVSPLNNLPIEPGHISLVDYSGFQHGRGHPWPSGISYDYNTFAYYPKFGFVGTDSATYKILDKDNSRNYIYKTYNITVLKHPYEGNEDFTLEYHCEREAEHYSGFHGASSFDVKIVDDGLRTIEAVQDNQAALYGAQSKTFPYRSRIWSDYIYSDAWVIDQESVDFHSSFLRNMNENILITCNYSRGEASLVYPIKYRSEWEATRKSVDFEFGRNDLFFYVSSLSDLHSKVYLKSYRSGFSASTALTKANEFMDKVFPGSHYTAELRSKYDQGDSSFYLALAFDEDNKLHLSKLEYLANELTNGDVSTLLEDIAENYEKYYLLGAQHCINSTICGVLFPEYTKSITSNSEFISGLEGWTSSINLYNTASGNIDWLVNEVSLELMTNTPVNNGEPLSTVDLYQSEYIGSSSVDDYYFHFDLNHAYGGSNGFAGFAGVRSSGFAGIFTCFNDTNGKTLGCLAWSDHTNKFDGAWTGRNGLDSTDTFYNIRLQNVIRRVAPSAERFSFTTSLGSFMQNHLPVVYSQKHLIRYIEYGAFTTEFRNGDQSCYYCDAKIKAKKINLLRKK